MTTDIHCRHRLPTPQTAGCMTWAALKEKALAYPHLRPCPKRKDKYGGWDWIYKVQCGKCRVAVRVEKEKAPATTGAKTNGASNG